MMFKRGGGKEPQVPWFCPPFSSGAQVIFLKIQVSLRRSLLRSFLSSDSPEPLSQVPRGPEPVPSPTPRPPGVCGLVPRRGCFILPPWSLSSLPSRGGDHFLLSALCRAIALNPQVYLHLLQPKFSADKKHA